MSMHNIHEINIYFDYSINVELSKNNKNGILIFDIKFNYEIFKILLDTKDVFFNNTKKVKNKNLIFKKTENNDLINKIIFSDEILFIKNIYLFENSKPDEYNLNSYFDIKFNNLKYIFNINKNISKNDINNIMNNVMAYIYNYYFYWKDYNESNNRFFFDYSNFFKFIIDYNVNIQHLIDKIMYELKKYKDFFSKIIIIN